MNKLVKFKPYLVLIIYTAVVFQSCKREKSVVKNSIITENPQQESFYNWIENKIELPDSLPTNFDFSKRYTEKEITALHLDTTKIGLNEYYLMSDQQFLSEKKDSISFLIYFKHTYGDQLEKILRVKRPDSIFDITLAMSGGDGQDTYTISTEFVNDSIFKKTFKHEQTEKDNTHLMAYGIDSIITTYKYNMGFDLKEIKKDSFHIYKELPIFHKNLIGKSFKVRSLPFEINGLNCQWEYIVRYSESINSKSEKILVDLLGQKLVEFTTKRVLLDLDLDQFYFVYNPIDLSSLDYNKNIFRNKARKAMYSYTNDSTDINLDGHYDFKFFTESAGGGANESYITYLFNPELKVFELSEIFSGTNLTYDSNKNRISTWGKSGVDDYFYSYTNLKPNRKDIDFVETAHRYGDTIFYEKIVDSVVVLKKKIIMDNSDGWESWLERI